MLLYEVTITVQSEIEKEWLQWMKTQHVPHVLATGLISAYQLLKKEGSRTYVFHYYFNDKKVYNEYKEKHASILQKEGKEIYDDEFKTSRKILLTG